MSTPVALNKWVQVTWRDLDGLIPVVSQMCYSKDGDLPDIDRAATALGIVGGTSYNFTLALTGTSGTLVVGGVTTQLTGIIGPINNIALEAPNTTQWSSAKLSNLWLKAN